jgi:hypothetical protein
MFGANGGIGHLIWQTWHWARWFGYDASNHWWVQGRIKEYRDTRKAVFLRRALLRLTHPTATIARPR